MLAFAATRLFGVQPYVVASGSMEPEYPTGSLIYVREVPAEQIQTGQAITFVIPDTELTATHQVREIDRVNRQFYTQGINNRDEQGTILPDAEPVPFDCLIGVPVACIPVLGVINRFCTTAPGLYLLLGSLVLVVGISIWLDRYRAQTSSQKS